MNWKQTLAKGLVVGGLAAVAVWAADVQTVQAWWVPLAAIGLETVRDLIKRKWPAYTPPEGN